MRQPRAQRFSALSADLLPVAVRDRLLAGSLLAGSSGQWAGIASFSGLTADSVAALQQAAEGIPGAQFVNFTQAISRELAVCKHNVQKVLLLTLMLLAAYFAVLYGRQWWRLWLPCALTAAASQSLITLIGVPWSLFSVLPLVLVLGLCVDYTVIAHCEAKSPWVWDSLVLAGASTICAFGFLAFSSTPALFAFGLTVTVGIGLAWIMTLLLKRSA